jgi:hypothetical protein
MPELNSVRAAGKLAINVTWSKGPRAGRTETIDLSPLVGAFKFYKALRNNPALFKTVHLVEDGRAIAWGDDDAIDMAVISVERLADEGLTADEFREFLECEGLTQDAAAAMLGYSRRQIAHYVAGDKPIPRVFALACRALALRRAADDTAGRGLKRAAVSENPPRSGSP